MIHFKIVWFSPDNFFLILGATPQKKQQQKKTILVCKKKKKIIIIRALKCTIRTCYRRTADVLFIFIISAGINYNRMILIIICMRVESDSLGHLLPLTKWGGSTRASRRVKKNPGQWMRQRQILRSMTAVTARSDSPLRQVHSVSQLKMSLFSLETGSCPLPAQCITSCSLSGSIRLFLLEQLPFKQKPGLTNDKRGKRKNDVWTCVTLWRWRSEQIP